MNNYYNKEKMVIKMIFKKALFFISLSVAFHSLNAQTNLSNERYVSKVWVADNGNGTYKNSVLNADYSDPDAIRVGDDFYLVSSSFEDIPGLPILHSKDLVNWSIIGHALLRQPPYGHFSIPQHGNGVWAPSIRYHNGEFYIYYPDPDYGIYVVKSKLAEGPWSDPVLVEGGKGLIDPCPLWDDDGLLYLVHAFAGSRAGIKSILVIKKLNKDGTKVIDEGRLVYDGHVKDPTVEGPKLYKRNGYYYIFAPAGGVTSGWQLVLRSKNIFGPYERKVVLDQGSTNVNGPHQGAWVSTQTGEDWFLHFQDKGVYGRVVHLEPMKWIDNWPVIGVNQNADGKGEPVSIFKKPNVGKTYAITTPEESDEFNENKLSMQWQWMGNPQPNWYFMDAAHGKLRLYSINIADSLKNLWGSPNVLLQKFPAEEFMATVKMFFHPNNKLKNEKAGLTIMGMSYANIALESKVDGNYLVYSVCTNADNGNKEIEREITKVNADSIFLRVSVESGGKCHFSYSLDGSSFINLVKEFIATPGKWIGAKVGIFCSKENQTNDSCYADFDWFRIDQNE
jgi:beta-xylosidase